VVDSADKLRIQVAKYELDTVLDHPKIKQREVPVLLFANKMDLATAMGAGEVAKELGLDAITDR